MKWTLLCLLSAATPVAGLAACSGASETGLFAPCNANADAGATCSSTDPSNPFLPHDGGGTPGAPGGPGSPGAPGAADAGAGAGDAAVTLGGPCERDEECPGAICNWKLQVCASLETAGGACERDEECASSLCNWKLQACSTPLPKGGRCERDEECAGGVCNTATETCE